MISKDVINRILWACIEDFIGIWEVVWELNSLNLKINARDTAKSIVKYLIKNKLIKLYYAQWGSQDKLIEIVNDRNYSIILNDDYWNPPSLNEQCIKIGSTKKGEKYYKNNI